MNILVCIKQVPGSSNVEVDPVTGVLKRDGVKSKMNPYDLYGLETAIALAEKYGGGGHDCASGARVKSKREMRSLLADADALIKKYKSENNGWM